MMVYEWILTIHEEGYPDAEYVLNHGNKVIVGRSRVCDITVNDPSVSRKHCVLEAMNDGSLRSADLGASHPVKINGLAATVGESFEIHDGDEMVLGKKSSIRISKNDLDENPGGNDLTCLVDFNEDRTMAFTEEHSAELSAIDDENDGTRALPADEAVSADQGTRMLDPALISELMNAPEATRSLNPVDENEVTKTRFIDGLDIPITLDGKDENEVPEETRYIAPQDLQALVDGKKKKPVAEGKQKKTRLILMGLLLAACALLLLPKPEGKELQPGPGEEGETSKFTYSLPPAWKISLENDGSFSFTERGRIRVLIRTSRGNPVTRWTYDTCLDQQLPLLLERKEISSEQRGGWVFKENSGSSGLPRLELDRASGRDIPYASLYQSSDVNGLKGRIYMNDDMAICLIYWPGSDAVYQFLKDFRMAGESDYIDRRLFPHDFEESELQERLNSASSLLRNHGNEADNYWRAYEELLCLWSWGSRNRMNETLQNESWRLLKSTAAWLEDDYIETCGRLMREQRPEERDGLLYNARSGIPTWDWRHQHISNFLED